MHRRPIARRRRARSLLVAAHVKSIAMQSGEERRLREFDVALNSRITGSPNGWIGARGSRSASRVQEVPQMEDNAPALTDDDAGQRSRYYGKGFTTRASTYAVRKGRHAVRFQILRPIPEIWRYAGSPRASNNVIAGSMLRRASCRRQSNRKDGTFRHETSAEKSEHDHSLGQAA